MIAVHIAVRGAVRWTVLLESLDHTAVHLMVRITDRVCVGALMVAGKLIDGSEATIVVDLGLHVVLMMLLGVGALGLLIRLTVVERHIEALRFCSIGLDEGVGLNVWSEYLKSQELMKGRF